MPAGIYIHTPFCRSRCSYCDFATGMYESEAAARYARALTSEISAWNMLTSPEQVDTIYFGGGTPSLLSVAQLEGVLDAVHRRFEVSPDAEITLEINPGDGGTSPASKRNSLDAATTALKRNGLDAATTAPKPNSLDAATTALKRNSLDAALVRRGPKNKFFRELRSLGINRASFGAQTFNNRELKMLGRTHDAAAISQTFALLRDAGFANINFDLIAGLPHQTLAGWKQNLQRALELRPEHLSLYLLDVHEGTPLHDQIERGMRPKPDEDLAGEMYSVMIEQVCRAGYEHYEISNFCLPGFASRHNTKYWTREPYYGFGNSAHSHDGAQRRWANERDAAKYVELIERGDSPIVERSELTDDDMRSEAIFLGLRLMRGVALARYHAQFGRDLREQYNGEIGRLQDAGLIEIDSEVLRLTKRGALLSNEVFAALA
jgi:oxygen-independent coproporphyrinogen III oxidase